MQNYDCLSAINRGVWCIFLEEIETIAPHADNALKHRIADVATFLLSAQKSVQAGRAVEDWIRLYVRAPWQLHRIFKELGVKPDGNQSMIGKISDTASDWVIGKLSDHPIRDMPQC